MPRVSGYLFTLHALAVLSPATLDEALGVLRHFGITLSPGKTTVDVANRVGEDRWFPRNPDRRPTPAAVYRRILDALGHHEQLSADVVTYDYEIGGEWSDYVDYLYRLAGLARVRPSRVAVSDLTAGDDGSKWVVLSFTIQDDAFRWALPQHNADASLDFVPRVAGLLRRLDPARVLASAGDAFILIPSQQASAFEHATGLACRVERTYPGAV